MKIKKSKNIFSDVEVTNVFTYTNNTYMRTEDIEDYNGNPFNSVNLETGQFMQFEDEAEITLYEQAELNLKN